jgi:hypothetical protein
VHLPALCTGGIDQRARRDPRCCLRRNETAGRAALAHPGDVTAKVEGNQIATGVDGNILVGKDFLAHFTRDLAENQVQPALRFVMLHELVHVAQSHDIPDVSPADPSRKAFECQADMLAATATLETQIMGVSLSDKTGAGGKSCWRRRVCSNSLAPMPNSRMLPRRPCPGTSTSANAHWPCSSA